MTFFSALAESSHHISQDSTFAVEIRYQSPPTDSIVVERVYRRHADISTWPGTREISLKSMPRSVAIRVCSLWDNCVEESARRGCPNHNNGFEPGIIIRQLGTRRACSGQRHVEYAVSTYRFLIFGYSLSGRINNVKLSTFCNLRRREAMVTLISFMG